MAQPQYNPSNIIARLETTPIIDQELMRVVFVSTLQGRVIVEIQLSSWARLETYQSVRVDHELLLQPQRAQELSDWMDRLMMSDKPPKAMNAFIALRYNVLANMYLPFLAPIIKQNNELIPFRSVLFPANLLPIGAIPRGFLPAENMPARPEEGKAPPRNAFLWDLTPNRDIDTLYIPVPVSGHANSVNFYLPLKCHSYIYYTHLHTVLQGNFNNFTELFECLPYIDHTPTLTEYKMGRLIMTQELSLKILESLIRGKKNTNMSDLCLMGGALMGMREDDIFRLVKRCFECSNYINALKYLSSFSKYDHVIIDTRTRESAINIMSHIYRIVDPLRTLRDILTYLIEDLENGTSLNKKFYVNAVHTTRRGVVRYADMTRTELDKLLLATTESYDKLAPRAIRAATALAEDNCVRLHPATSYKRLKPYIYVHATTDESKDDDGFSNHDVVNYMRHHELRAQVRQWSNAQQKV